MLKVDIDDAFFLFQETRQNMAAIALLYYTVLKALLGDDALKLQ